MAKPIRAIFFDAGNTLLYPRVDELAAELTAGGFSASVADFHAAERAAKRRMDEWLWPKLGTSELPRLVDRMYWTEFLRALLERLKVPEARQAEITHQIIERFRDIQFWSRVYPETEPALRAIRDAGYYLGVISNSVGTMEEQFGRVGLRQYFREVLDSAVVGVEKPDPRIFRMALAAAGAPPDEALFVGDTYSTDIGGARLAGMRGVLIDRIGVYDDTLTCQRIESLEGFPQMVSML
jgi:HAD superfamily hydrolase (TIGR01509 family)